MSFDWVEFLQLAEGLQRAPDSPGPPEAALRSAASRAYYAALHCALGFAREEGFEPSSFRSIHHEVPDYFRRQRGPDSKMRNKIAVELDRLRSRRNEADYDDRLRRQPNSQAHLAIGMARRILTNLRSLSNDRQGSVARKSQ